MENKRFVVEIPADKHEEAVKLAKANGINLTSLVRSLLIRATMMPEQFGYVPVVEDFRQALAGAKDPTMAEYA